MSKRGVTTAVVALAALATITTQAVSASAGGSSDELSSANQLAGTWVVTVNRPAPLPPLTSLQVFAAGGSQIEMANEWQATRTAQYGSWSHMAARTYAATGVFFRFDPQTGVYVSRQKIDRTIELSPDGQSFTATGQATVYSPGGSILATFPVSATGERLRVEKQ